MTKQSKYEASVTQPQRILMNKQAGTGAQSSFDDSSSLSSYSSLSLENESMSMSMSTATNDPLMKAALTLTARRTYPRRSAPTIATGRRNLKSETVPREEAERRRVRRERNKQAATRCRQKRNEITGLLQHTVDQLEAEKRRDEEQLRTLETMRNHLQFVLNAHESVCEQQRAHQRQMAMQHSMFGNTMRPQTLLYGGQLMQGNASTAITPATELLAFADSSGLPPLLSLNNAANRCFGQQQLSA